MAVTDYASLQASLADTTLRDPTQIPNFIAKFEARINRRLRVRAMEAQATLTPNASGIASLPADFLEKRRLTYQGSPLRELDYVTPSQLILANPNSASGLPSLFTIEGGSIKIAPISTTALTLDYWQKIPSLSVSATTNWLLTSHPDLYEAGSLVEAFLYSREPDAASMWKSREEEITTDLLRLDGNGIGAVAIRPSGPTP